MAKDIKRDIEGFEPEPKGNNAPLGKSYILGIGINAYTHFTKLNNAVKDVEDIINLLTNQYRFSATDEYLKILRDKDATRSNIIRHLKSLCKKVKPDDRVLIYYSGHGYMDELTGRGYWIPVNAQKEDDASYVANSDIRDYLKAMKCRHSLLISDSCFSGSLLARNATREIDGAFAKWESNKSRWVFCSGKGIVSDGKAGSNSPFTQQLIQHLSDPDLEKINIARLADDVTKSVSFNYEQQAEASPIRFAGHNSGQFIFYRKLKPSEQEEKKFKEVLASRKERKLQLFLIESKNRVHKKEVRALLKGIEEDKIWRKLNKNSFASLDEFIEENSNHPKVGEAQELLKKLLDTAKTGTTKKSKKKGTSKVIKATPHIIKETNIFTDPRDGQTYKTIKLKDGKIWMAQNLNFEMPPIEVEKGWVFKRKHQIEQSWFYRGNPKNEDKYGRLYRWDAAIHACPEGWHLPSDEEWMTMISKYGNTRKKSYNELIETGGSGFCAQFGGCGRPDGTFGKLGINGFYWSNSYVNNIEGEEAIGYGFYSNNSLLRRAAYKKENGRSVRGVKND